MRLPHKQLPKKQTPLGLLKFWLVRKCAEHGFPIFGQVRLEGAAWVLGTAPRQPSMQVMTGPSSSHKMQQSRM
jgi:hypothetical protein